MEKIKVIYNVNIVLEDRIQYGYVKIEGEKIAKIGEGNYEKAGEEELINGHGNFLLPGGVDPHVHIRYPGGKLRETFYTGTAAAARGGVTTVIEHPISTPPQHDRESLQRRIDAVEKESVVDVVFYGAAGGECIHDIRTLADCGICAYKTFLHQAPEGRAQEFVGLTSKDTFELYEVMKEVASTGLLMAAHGEDNDMVTGAIRKLRKEGKTYPHAHCDSRPSIVEVLAVERLITIAKETGARLYLVHMSTPEAVKKALEAKKEGMEIYIETCPHYLYMNSDCLDKYGAYVKCNPALRDQNVIDELWKYVEAGDIDCIGSDHSPYQVEEKEKGKDDIFAAPSGFPGIETRLGYILKAVSEGRISLIHAVNMLSTNPAKIFGLYPRKGAIREGADADLLLVDPYEEYIAQADDMFTMSKDVCHFVDGTHLYGPVQKTYVRGSLVYDGTKITVPEGYGSWLNVKKM